MRSLTVIALCLLASPAVAQVQIVVNTAKPRQTFDGLGCGAIFFEQHITSLAARNKNELQDKLYDDMFTKAPTRFLQLMIRETHEPENDNKDPYMPAFDDKNFDYCEHTLKIAKEALKRQPDIQFLATLYSPAPWMKTNGMASGGGEAKHSIKPGMELELAEYIWAFLAHMKKNGVKVQYVCIANECDFPHEQPGYFLTPDRYAALFKIVGDYFDVMAKKHPEVTRPKLVGPNTLSAPAAALDYVPRILKTSPKHLDVIGAHDYDPRGDRWGLLKKLGGTRPVWVTEWCARGKDPSPGMIKSGIEYAVEMHDAFLGGVNVFMAYDWVYPPRDSGEGLIHVDWGNSYTLTKPYHVFRQWAAPVKPGMKLVETGVFTKTPTGVRATALLGENLVVHVVNAQDKESAITLKLQGKFTSASAARTRTSATEDAAELPALAAAGGVFPDTLPARSMVTYRFEAAGK